MSAVSTIYDKLSALVAATLTGYKLLPNPYVIEHNADLILAKGYGVGIGDGQAVELSTGTNRGRSRTFPVVVTNLVTCTDHDVAGRETQEKALAEAVIAIENALERDNSLTGSALKVDYVNDTGVAFLAKEAGKFKYLVITVSFLVLYEESIT